MRRRLAISCACAALLACGAGPKAPIEIPSSLSPTDLQTVRANLERMRAQDPDSAAIRVALGQVHYRIARDALDRTRDEAAYLSHFEQATDAFVAALEIDPTLADPHIFLGAMDTYRGEIDEALLSFHIAKRLSSQGVAYTNLAEILIYMDRVPEARQWNQLAARKRAPFGALAFNEMLIAWKTGRLRSAEAEFERLRIHSPQSLREINMARVPQEPRRFREFAAYCCGSPACGPYMREACASLTLDVNDRVISEEAIRKELVIEMERQRRLRRVYEQRKELEIEIDDTRREP